MYITIYSRRAARWDGPHGAAIRPQNEPRTTNNLKGLSHVRQALFKTVGARTWRARTVYVSIS